MLTRARRFVDALDPQHDPTKRVVGWIVFALTTLAGFAAIGIGIGMIVAEDLLASGFGVLSLGVLVVITPWLVRPLEKVPAAGFVLLVAGLFGGAALMVAEKVAAGVILGDVCVAAALYVVFGR